MGFFVFVPIATFDSIATSINLHFFLLFTSLLILLTSDKKSSLLGHIIVLLTCLSDPLAVLILPAVLLRFLIIRSINKYIVTLALSLLIQFFSVFIFIGNSTREIGHNTSIIKTTYLFMDRVVGSSLIPFWGFVDGNASQSVGISKALLFRLFASFIVLSLCIYIVIHTFTINGKNFHDDNSLLTGLLILTIGLYWSVTGLFFNPEPRYAIFPSLCLITVLLLNLDSIVYHIKSSKLSKPIVYLISFLFIAIAIGSFHASSFRDTNLSWRAQLEEAKSECKNSQILFAKIEIPPERNKLAVVLRCKLLIE